MKVTGAYQFVAAREDVWTALHDPQILAATLPGGRRLEPTGPNEYVISVDVGVGSVKGTYEGTFTLIDTADCEACTVRATASGRPGTVQAVAEMRLVDGEGGAHLSYEADATVTGPLAGVGQRLTAAAARRTTELFLTALDAHITAPPGAAPAAAEAEAPWGEIVPVARQPAGARVIVASGLAGALIALLGVAVGRWTARR